MKDILRGFREGIGMFICLFRPHKWSKPREPQGADVTHRVKSCRRCGLTREVRARKRPEQWKEAA